jgi:hypothetical protein
MKKKDLWKIGIVLGTLIIIISLYLVYFVFGNTCSIAKFVSRENSVTCMPGPMPPSPIIYLGLFGIFILLASLIIFIINKIKKSKHKK